MATVIIMAMQILLIGGITYCEWRRRTDPADWLRNLQAWSLYYAVALFVLPFFAGWNGASLIEGKALPFIVAFPLLLVVQDFLEFAFHRAQHRIPLLWRMHSLHHSDPNMSALTTNRHFWGDQLIKALTIWPLTFAIISPTGGMLFTYALVSLYNNFIHANLQVNFGKWSWVLNCPAYHRRHHSSLPQHYDANFAALLPIWDVIFGSYHRPDGWPPTGLATAPASIADLALWPLLNHEPETVTSSLATGYDATCHNP